VRVEAWLAIAEAFFERAAVLEIGGDPRCPKAVIAELGGEPAPTMRRRIIA
jgi:hypothetical protein